MTAGQVLINGEEYYFLNKCSEWLDLKQIFMQYTRMGLSDF